MKFLRVIPIVALLYALAITGTTSLTSCKKDSDTTIVRDTIIIRDTVVVKDSCKKTEVLDTSLVAYYNFNGANLNDSSGKGNNIIFNNATPTTDRFGVANNAYLFNGTSSYMRITNSASLNPTRITLTAIVKPNGFYSGFCHGNEILGKGPDGGQGFYCLRYSDNLPCNDPINPARTYFYGGYGNVLLSNNSAAVNADSVFIKTGQWYHIVYTYDGTTCKFYINGQLKAQYARTAIFTPNTSDINIGKHANTQYPYWMNGALDELRIYNRALTAQEVENLYNGTKSYTCSCNSDARMLQK